MSLAGVVVLLTLLGCKKEDSISPSLFFSTLPSVCLNRSIDPVSSSPYQNLVWADEFNGPEPGDDPSCFTRSPNCRVRLDAFATGPCPADFDATRIGLLNKCNWNLWAGFSFWDKTSQSSYHPALIQVKDGHLALAARYRSDRTHPKCGIKPGENAAFSNPNYYDRECVLEMGGVDSGSGLPKTHGRTFQDGRVEMRVRFPGQTGSAPALWSWPVMLNEGHPYSRSTWDGYRIGEFDLVETHTRAGSELEAFSTYHDWGPPNSKHLSSSTAGYRLPVNQWIRFGLERGFSSDGKTRTARWYVGDGSTTCVIKELRDGDQRMNLSDWPNFLIMNFQGESWWGSLRLLQGAALEVDYVRLYEK